MINPKNLSEFQKNKSEKLDAITTGVSIERRHKDFLEKNNLNLSALVRALLDFLISPKGKESKK